MLTNTKRKHPDFVLQSRLFCLRCNICTPVDCLFSEWTQLGPQDVSLCLRRHELLSCWRFIFCVLVSPANSFFKDGLMSRQMSNVFQLIKNFFKQVVSNQLALQSFSPRWFDGADCIGLRFRHRSIQVRRKRQVVSERPFLFEDKTLT